MDGFEAVAKRHSYRGPFKDQQVPRDDLRCIVQAGLQVPSGTNAQTTTFVIVDAPDLIAKIRKMHPAQKAMRQAPAYIVCIVDKEPEAVYETHSFQIEDCAAAVENILLAVTALAYATVWIDGWLRGFRNKQRKSGRCSDFLTARSYVCSYRLVFQSRRISNARRNRLRNAPGSIVTVKSQ
jgi:nitroreductase